MTILFLVDVENGCQNFLKCEEAENNNRSWSYGQKPFEVEAFVQKGADTTAVKFSTDIMTTHECMTNCPEAADVALVMYAAGLLQNSSGSGSQQSLRNYSKVFLVKGAEKGYGELIARLKCSLGDKFEEIDGRETNICDYIPDIACGYCKKIFRDAYTCKNHCNDNQACAYCKATFRCKGDREAKAKDHEVVRWTACSDLLCSHSFRKCCQKDPHNASHQATHPRCTDKNICGCNQQFLNSALLTMHCNEKCCFVCECFKRHPSLDSLTAHCKTEKHMCVCNRCHVRMNVKNYGKHAALCTK